ncbi:MAG: response regulator [Spirochaetales bacterium]|nr:response regulator [Spirochaetales bacterium]
MKTLKSFLSIKKIFLLGLIFIISCNTLSEQDKKNKIGQKGVIDLSQWNFKKDGIIKLRAEWEFYWGELLKPEDFTTARTPTGYMTLPSHWNYFKDKFPEIKGQGVATFRLQVKIPQDAEEITLRIPNQNTAYSCWIDDQLVTSGTVGNTKEESIPSSNITTITIPTNEKETITIVMQISNFHHKRGGMYNNILIGDKSTIENTFTKERNQDMFLFGALILMALYHFLIFILEKKDTSPIYFGALCFFIGVRIFLSKDYILDYFPNIPWDITYKIYYFCGYIATPLFATFIYKLYPKIVKKIILKIILVISIVNCLVVVFSPAIIYTHTANFFQIVILISFIYLSYVLIAAAIKREEGAMLFLASFIFMFATIILFLLYDHGKIDIGDPISLGMFIFIIAQSVIISMRFAKSFALVEVKSKEIEEIKNYLDNIINSMPSIIIGTNKNGIITQWNSEAEKTTRLGRDETIGRDIERLGTSLDQRIISSAKNFDDDRPLSLEKLKSSNGEKDLFYNAIIYPLKTDESDDIVIRIDDVTEIAENQEKLRVAQEEIRQHRDHLEDLVEQRTKELSIAKKTAEEASKSKSLFLSNMSHELRTPLNAILGYTQLMQYDATLNKKQKEFVDIINRSGEHLLALINDILEISRIEAKRINIESKPVNLPKMLRDLAEMFKLKTESRGIKFTIEGINSLPFFIISDENKLRQILINLLGNAVKFTEEGYITMRSEVNEKEKGKISLVFEIEDSGLGIAKNELKKLFKPFEQTESGKQSSLSGTGLGLAISKEYAKLLGGDISVKSKYGSGSKFTLTIETEVTKSVVEEFPLDKKIIGLKGGARPPRILIAEDKEDSRNLLVEMLSIINADVKTANDGVEAVRIAAEFEPHLIWMDIRMPNLDGLEATKQIKSNKEIKQPIIIALTAHALTEEKESILETGCDDFVRKPFQQIEIFETMQRHLKLEYLYDETDNK